MIRNATLEDIPRIVEMGERLFSDSNYKHMVYSQERVASTCHLLINSGFIVVAEKNAVVIGAMLGDVYTPWYTNDRMGTDYVLYIEPEHRNGLIALKMIKKFEQWCIGMNAKQIRPGISCGDKGARRLYEAAGYEVSGQQFVKDIK